MSLSGNVIDDIKAKATKIEAVETSFKGSRKSVVLLKVPGIDDVNKPLDYKDAHQYSKACVPRRVYELDENGAHATNETGEEIQRLRQPGDKGHTNFTLFAGERSHTKLYTILASALVYITRNSFSFLFSVQFCLY